MMATIDFETYSAAGYVWDPAAFKWTGKGLAAVGAAAYAEHATTEVLCLAYRLPGASLRLWEPSLPPPSDLFAHIEAGGLVEAWNSSFEFWVWFFVCFTRMGWPPLPLEQTRDAQARAYAWNLPGKLAKAAEAVDAPIQKDSEGERLIKLLSVPQKPTKKRPYMRVHPDDAPLDKMLMHSYCMTDVMAEDSMGEIMPHMPAMELPVWLMDQRINTRGVAVDTESLEACRALVDTELAKGNVRMLEVTGGAVPKVTSVPKLKAWLASRGLKVGSLDEEHLQALLDRPLAPDIREALEIRAQLGGAAVKKTHAMYHMLNQDGRLRGLLVYHGAGPGRWAGRGAQPQNLPKDGPEVYKCDHCGRYSGVSLPTCPWCMDEGFPLKGSKWGPDAAEDSLEAIRSQRPDILGDPLAHVSGCLRSLFVAGPGKEFISSDYNAIEAVALAMLSGEQWRIDVFRTHGKIYEESAARITGVPLDEMLEHKKRTGEHHPLRNSVGKVAELASGYRGWVAAWERFGARKYFATDEEIEANILKWRAASPMVKALWLGLEGAAGRAILSPGSVQRYRDITYQVDSDQDVMYCTLPSGRRLAYHAPRAEQGLRYDKPHLYISYCRYRGKEDDGETWKRVDIHGGPLTENVVQAVSRDILAYAMLNLEAQGYPVVLHVHDEPVSEVPTGYGSIEEYEAILMEMPWWAEGWPITASGGWRGVRFRK